MSKHTPESWTIFKYSESCFGIHDTNGKSVCMNDLYCSRNDADLPTLILKMQDNFNLIAAAPDLLEALYAASEGLECVAGTEGKAGCNHCLAKEAINKAEGK